MGHPTHQIAVHEGARSVRAQHETDIEADVRRAAEEAAARQMPLDLGDLDQRIKAAPHQSLPDSLEAQRDAWARHLAERDAANGNKGAQS